MKFLIKTLLFILLCSTTNCKIIDDLEKNNNEESTDHKNESKLIKRYLPAPTVSRAESHIGGVLDLNKTPIPVVVCTNNEITSSEVYASYEARYLNSFDVINSDEDYKEQIKKMYGKYSFKSHLVSDMKNLFLKLKEDAIYLDPDTKIQSNKALTDQMAAIIPDGCEIEYAGVRRNSNEYIVSDIYFSLSETQKAIFWTQQIFSDMAIHRYNEGPSSLIIRTMASTSFSKNSEQTIGANIKYFDWPDHVDVITLNNFDQGYLELHGTVDLESIDLISNTMVECSERPYVTREQVWIKEPLLSGDQFIFYIPPSCKFIGFNTSVSRGITAGENVYNLTLKYKHKIIRSFSRYIDTDNNDYPLYFAVYRL